VKHRSYDYKGGDFKILKSEAKLHFFCFRCNISKQAATQIHWTIPEVGEKVICLACYEEVAVRQEKKSKKQKKETKEPTAPDWALCPILLEEQEGDWRKQVPLAKVVAQFPNMKPETHEHYLQQLMGGVVELGFNPEGAPSPDAQWEVISTCLKEAENSEKQWNYFNEQQQKQLNRAKNAADFNLEKQRNGEEWGKLKSLDDLPKLRAILEDHLSTIVPNILPMWLEYTSLRKKDLREQKKVTPVKGKAAKKRKNPEAAEESTKGREEPQEDDASKKQSEAEQQRLQDLLTEFFKLFLSLAACGTSPSREDEVRLQIRDLFERVLESKIWTTKQRTKLEDLHTKVTRSL